MVNRLVLNLSRVVNTREDSESRSSTNLGPPTFAAGPFLGNIGGHVRTLPDDFYDEEEGAVDSNTIQADGSGQSDRDTSDAERSAASSRKVVEC